MVRAGSRKDASVWGRPEKLGPLSWFYSPSKTMPSELLAVQAGHSIVRDRTRACVPIARRFPEPLRRAEEDAWSEWEVLCMGSV